jgi:uncharacterized protein YdhG (YjbR/CyaY superfamily)
MASKKPAAKRPAKQSKGGLTAEERAAMKETLRERKGGGDGEAAVLAKIAAMKEPDRALARKIHAIVRGTAPELTPKTWYGMPAYANGDKIVCYFQDAAKFKSRYATLGFSDKAKLDDGKMWPIAYALVELTPADERRIAALVKQAIG